MKWTKTLGSVLAMLMFVAACGGQESTGTGGSGAGGSDAGVVVVPLQWQALTTEGAPLPRQMHSAVWTGSKMVVWGGRISGAPPVTATGGVYDPATRTWTPTSLVGAPEARYLHKAVWTGTRMLVWGGFGETALALTGGIYDPETDTWAPMSTTNQPEGRSMHTMVWTDTKVVVWGGLVDMMPLGSGGIYDPANDSWVSTSLQSAPTPRFLHSAVWSGSQMVVWGGTDFFDWLQTGAIFDPQMGSGGSWVGATNLDSAPSIRERHTGVWTGEGMLIWGGWNGGDYQNTGAVLDANGGWQAMSMTAAPAPRAEHVSVWTGQELIVWGGCTADLCATLLGDGGRFTPNAGGGQWTAIEEQAALSARRGATAVFTGKSILVWGGRKASSSELLGDGAESNELYP